MGSNTLAVSPKRTTDGSTLLDINSHQPWTGPVSWYEAHVHSEEGWDMEGGVFPGTPVILHGHNRNLGWAHTVNAPDLADIYELEINPANDMQYKFDGQWKDLEKFDIPITVKIFGSFTWTVHRDAFRSVYGPTIRNERGTYAIRYAGYVDPGPLRPPFLEIPAEVDTAMQRKAERWKALCAKYRPLYETKAA